MEIDVECVIVSSKSSRKAKKRRGSRKPGVDLAPTLLEHYLEIGRLLEENPELADCPVIVNSGCEATPLFRARIGVVARDTGYYRSYLRFYAANTPKARELTAKVPKVDGRSISHKCVCIDALDRGVEYDEKMKRLRLPTKLRYKEDSTK